MDSNNMLLLEVVTVKYSDTFHFWLITFALQHIEVIKISKSEICADLRVRTGFLTSESDILQARHAMRSVSSPCALSSRISLHIAKQRCVIRRTMLHPAWLLQVFQRYEPGRLVEIGTFSRDR